MISPWMRNPSAYEMFPGRLRPIPAAARRSTGSEQKQSEDVALETAVPAFAGDDDCGAYLFRGTCDAYAPDSVVTDVGYLDIEDDPSKEWAQLSPDNAPIPNPIRLEDKVTPSQLAGAEFAIAVTQSDSSDAKLIACGEIPQDAVLPFVSNLAEVEVPGVAGRVLVEADKQGVKITTAAYAKNAAPALGQ